MTEFKLGDLVVDKASVYQCDINNYIDIERITMPKVETIIEIHTVQKCCGTETKYCVVDEDGNERLVYGLQIRLASEFIDLLLKLLKTKPVYVKKEPEYED